MSEPRVVGLDLSLTATGIATPEGQRTIGTKARGCERLIELRDTIRKACELADLVAVEGYSFGSRNSHAHALGELGGVVRVALHVASVPFVEVPPSSLKKFATGKGNAGKEEVLASAIRRLGYEGHDNNEADALWLRAMGMDALGCPLVAMPESHRAALVKVEWPS